ncbi:MAG: hypothetical protein AB4911_10660 [Oscillochloridaceae bacterium umkhey_bin13]
MEMAAFGLLVVCYALAAYLAWAQRTPIYLIALLSGHLSALASPLWRTFYNFDYSLGLMSVRALFDQALPRSLILAAGWFYPLPAMIVYFLYRTRWWFPGLLTGILTFLIFLLYHLLIETLGLRQGLWSYRETALPLGLSAPILASLMTGMVSYGLLYAMLVADRYSWQSMLLALLPITLVLSILINGLLGAPFLLTTLFSDEPLASTIGLGLTLALLLWAFQIITSGIARLEHE